MRKKWPTNYFWILFLFILSLSFHLEVKHEAAGKKPINTCVHTFKKPSITNWLLDWQEWLRKHIKTDFKGHVLSYCVRALSMFLFLIQPQLFYSPGLTYITWNLTTIHLGTHYSNFFHDRFQCLTAFQIWSILDGSFDNQTHLFLVCTLFYVFSSFMCIKQRFKWVNVFRLNHKF